MWIVSQDGKAIANAGDFELLGANVYHGRREIDIRFGENSCFTLGVYENPEDVLSQIAVAYLEDEKVFYMPQEG